jgi:hypothetical protein
MMLARRTALATLSLVLVCLSVSTAAPLPRPLESHVVLARYAEALAGVSRPSAVEFEYTVEQLGARTLQQTHRVYRSGESERDEIVAADGQKLSRPSVRILLNRGYPYDVRSIAPQPATYTFIYTGTLMQPNDRFVYLYRTEPKGLEGNFVVDEVGIDGASFLPVSMHFRIAGAGAHGSGRIEYARFDRYWLVREAEVAVHMPKGSLANERIVWSKYQFPPSLPPETFREPRPAATSPEEPGNVSVP